MKLLFDEKLSEIMDEIADAETQRINIFAEIGEKAFSVVRDNPEFTELTGKIDEITSRFEELQQRKADLLEEKERYEKEEKERIARLTCFKCRKVSSDESKFCEECGAKLGELPREYCKNCGTLNQPNMKFCGECGTKLA